VFFFHPVQVVERHEQELTVLKALDVVDSVTHVLFTVSRCGNRDALFLVDEKLRVVNHDVFDAEKLEIAWLLFIRALDLVLPRLLRVYECKDFLLV